MLRKFFHWRDSDPLWRKFLKVFFFGFYKDKRLRFWLLVLAIVPGTFILILASGPERFKFWQLSVLGSFWGLVGISVLITSTIIYLLLYTIGRYADQKLSNTHRLYA